MEILDCKTDIGLLRRQNEDSVLVLRHKKNKNIKLLICADGMGGKEYGEIASTFVTSSLEKWFQKKGVKELNNISKMEKLIPRYCKTMNSKLIKKYGEDKLGTTLALALITKKNTLICNIGDSRTYIYQKRKLIQITEDHSDIWEYFETKKVKKEHLRFFSNSNVINSCIGISKDLCIASIYIIDNDYDILLQFTDGVTDCLMDKKIKKIIKKTPKMYLLQEIINEAVYKKQKYHIPRYLKRKKYSDYMIPTNGRDNASGTIYIKDV